MNEATMTVTCDRQTAAFYGTLLLLTLLDLILLFWMFMPMTTFGTAHVTSPRAVAAPVVADAAKPSPFDLAAAKKAPVKRSVKPQAVAAFFQVR